jgi:cell division protein FtsI (penicillin-binding protein 3)
MRIDPVLAEQSFSTAVAERRRRVGLVGLAFGVAFASIALRLLSMVEWQEGVSPGSVIAPAANAALTPADEMGLPTRAEITDRRGELLATNLDVPSLAVNPTFIKDKDETARRLAAVLSGVDADELARRLKSKGKFAWIKHQITPREQKAVLELGIPGAEFRSTSHRVYPKQNLTSHVVGFVNIDNLGQAGIELSMEDRLSLGAAKGPVALSLDLRIQQIVREELFRAFVRLHAVGANAIVQDIVTGEILAMVSLPDFDPNRAETASGLEQTNRNTNAIYEVGSLMKVMSIAAALDSGKVTVASGYDASTTLRIRGARINDVKGKHRWLTVPECFMFSSNICTAKVALDIGGKAVLDPFYRRLGFYEKPDIELAQREIRLPQLPNARWADVTTATTSYGHGIGISPLQYVDALVGIAGGNEHWVKPTLLRRNGSAPSRPAPVSAATAADMRWMMWLTVEKGTARSARLPAYMLGGKTGTADKSRRSEGYQKNTVLASFAGVFPIEAPRYAVLAMVDEPKGDQSTGGTRYGGAVAGPIVRDIVDRIGPLLGRGPSAPDARDAFMDRLSITKNEGRGGDHFAVVGPPPP